MWVIVHQSDFYAFVLAFSVYLVFNLFEFLFMEVYLAVVKEYLFVRAPTRRIKTTKRFELFFVDFDTCFLLYLLHSNSYKVSAFIDHACWGFEHGLLNGNSVLLHEQDFVVD